MNFANPAGWWFALGALVVIAVHILRPRRVGHVVSSTMLWNEIERPVTAATPFHRLRPSWLLASQLAAVGLLAAALANPVRVTPVEFAPHTVFLIDDSASMQALDGSPTRLADAQERAIALRRQLPEGALASAVEVGPVPRVLLSSSADVAAFDDAVRSIQGTDAIADFAGAFALAEGLETADASIGFVLVSDGGLDADAQRLIPAGMRYERVGSASTNRAIVDLAVEPTSSGLHVAVTVANLGGAATTQTLRLDVDGRTRERVELDIAAGSTVVHETDVAVGDRIEAYLEGEDLLAADNRRSAVANRRQTMRVAVVGTADPFVDALLAAIDGIEVVETVIDADVVIYDGSTVPSDPTRPFLAIAPTGGSPGVKLVGTVENPVVSLIRVDDAVLSGLDLSDLAVATAQKIDAGASEVLLGAESAPLLVRGRTDAGVRFAYMSFEPSQSNLPVQVAFPLLGDRLLAELTGASLPPADLVVGDLLPVPIRTGAKVTDPYGTSTEVRAGTAGVLTERPGVWTVEAPDRPLTAVAVNPPPAESNVTPVPVLPTEIRVLRPGETPPVDTTSLRNWVIAALAAVLVAEWWLARRSVGVPPRQWKAAQALRVVTALALLAAALGLGVNRPAGSVATVFVVDASDSMGPAGRAAALDVVRESLRHQGGGDRAAVVRFGGDARIEALLSDEVALDRDLVEIDASRTDLAGALRLGGAILPDDARRRIVLITDGRATDGDAVREAEALREVGVSVDTVLIDAAGAVDVAVAAVRVPSSVSQGEQVPILVELESSTAGPAVVTLRADGEVIATQQITLKVGRQTIEFSDVAADTGPRRYQVDVSSPNDGVVQNDLGFAAVDVAGPPRVLVVEGAPDESVELAGALRAGQLDVDVVGVGDVPNLDVLVGYDSIVLVDVDRRSLTTAQIAALAGAVRDSGRGLVTIGGDRAYGLGGYYTSELEQLLPVVSEILDPKRRRTVAEVLAIDSSGSMGACHCAEGQFASNRIDGGVIKTDIARAAAARTISALSDNDEVGVLAFDVENRWAIDLQKLPPQEVVDAGLSRINPDGGTNPSETLTTAAEALRESNAALKHIILFTDGFTSTAIMEDLAIQAGNLAAEGITVSVVATGEGATRELSKVAAAGQGRFYPGRNLQQIPEIIMDEAVLASRDFVTEGTFSPIITSSLPVVSWLTESPPLLGYVATTAKPTATSLLRIGPDADPLLATWRVGLGTATSWTSDASARWSQTWATWDGYVRFWSTVVRDTFPAESDGTTATVDDGVLRIRIEGSSSFGDGATAVAHVVDPNLVSQEVVLQRVGPDAFVGELAVDTPGSYAVGTSVVNAAGDAVQGSTVANQSYSPEYRPGEPDGAALERIASAGGGRAAITPQQAFDRAGLAVGTSHLRLVTWLLVLAVVTFLAGVVLSRLSFAGSVARPAGTPSRGRRWRMRLAALRQARGDKAAEAATRVEQPRVVDEDQDLLEQIAQSEREAAAAEEAATMSALLERTRRRRDRDR